MDRDTAYRWLVTNPARWWDQLHRAWVIWLIIGTTLCFAAVAYNLMAWGLGWPIH